MLSDILSPGLRVVIVGTAVGETSAARGHYYAGRGNKFWQLLHDSGLVPERLGPEDDHRLPEFGIGLTDLNKTVAQSHDRGLRYDPEALRAKVAEHRPSWIAFHGKTAAAAYRAVARREKPDLGEQPWPVAGARAFVLPNASGAHAVPYAEKLKGWTELAELVRAVPAAR